MATRTSLYGSVASMIPDWVFGGEYGDLTKLMNAREASYENLWQQQEQTRQQQQRTQINDATIQELQQQQAMADALDQQFKTSRPASLRDAYESMLNLALDSGDSGGVMKAMGFLNDVDESDRKRKLSDLKDAANLAGDGLGFDRINGLFPNVLTSQDVAAIASRSRRGGEGYTDRNVTYLLDPKTRLPVQVPRSEYNNYISAGYLDPTRSDPEKVIKAMMPQGNSDTPPTESGPGVIDSFLGWLGSKPGEAPAQKQKALVKDIPATYGGTPPRKAAKGMKWQQNTSTGEFREVPR